MWHISLPHILQNNDLQCCLKNGGGDRKRRLSRVHCICTMHCVQCTLEKQCTANHVINGELSNQNKISESDCLSMSEYLGHLWVVKNYIITMSAIKYPYSNLPCKKRIAILVQGNWVAVGINNVMLLRTVACQPPGHSTRPGTYHCNTSSHQQSNGING